MFVGYQSPGYTVLDRRLYVPLEWLTDEAYTNDAGQCGLPSDLPFKNQARVAAGDGSQR